LNIGPIKINDYIPLSNYGYVYGSLRINLCAILHNLCLFLIQFKFNEWFQRNENIMKNYFKQWRRAVSTPWLLAKTQGVFGKYQEK